MSSLGNYLVGDCEQLEKVQRRAARFFKRDYSSTTSVSSLISQLGWQTLSGRRRNSRLSLMYKSLHGLAGISISPFRRCSKPTRSADDNTFCVLSSRIDRLWALVGEVPRHRRADRPLWDGPTSAVARRPL